MTSLRTAREWIGREPFPWPSLHELDVGQVLSACYAVVALEVGTTKNDKPYLTLRLSDRHGTVEAKVWDDAEAVRARIEPGLFVGVRGRVERFRDARQLKVEVIEPIRLDADELELFMPRSSRDLAEMEAELDRWIGSIREAPLRTLVGRLLGPDVESGRAFRRAPAAKRNHHAWIGGLMEHTLSLAGICDRVARHYGARIDRDLLLAGALLHDLGKIREIALEPGFAYTTEGKLLGHILLGLEMVRDAARDVPALDPARLELLLHLVASHQGRYEWQSPREPLVVEAILLHHADDMDAKMQQAFDLVADVEDGWSRYDRSLGRELLRHRGPQTQARARPVAGPREGAGSAPTAPTGPVTPSEPGGAQRDEPPQGVPLDPFTLDMFEE